MILYLINRIKELTLCLDLLVYKKVNETLPNIFFFTNKLFTNITMSYNTVVKWGTVHRVTHLYIIIYIYTNCNTIWWNINTLCTFLAKYILNLSSLENRTPFDPSLLHFEVRLQQSWTVFICAIWDSIHCEFN